MKIWRCPSCNTGLRAPKTMGQDDIRRYCLICSEKSGSLVRRAMVSSLTMKENRKEETKARRVQLQEESDCYPWLIRDEFAKIIKLICWNNRDEIKRMGIEITYSKRMVGSTCHYDAQTHKIMLKAGKKRAHAYAAMFWSIAWADTRIISKVPLHHYDTFLSAVSSFLDESLHHCGFGDVISALEPYVENMKDSTVTNIKVRRQSKKKKKKPKTKLGSAISGRSKKAVW